MTVGAARQYSGALGGIGVCQVAVHLIYASKSGQTLVDRALYLTRDWAADDERRELTGVPDELALAAKPQLAAAMLERVHQADLPARQVAAAVDAPLPSAIAGGQRVHCI
jgi:SRSO17 transposase